MTLCLNSVLGSTTVSVNSSNEIKSRVLKYACSYIPPLFVFRFSGMSEVEDVALHHSGIEGTPIEKKRQIPNQLGATCTWKNNSCMSMRLTETSWS